MKALPARPRDRTGRYSVAAESRRMIERGLGLSELEIERFYARVNRVRNPPPVKASGVEELRIMIELAHRRERQ